MSFFRHLDHYDPFLEACTRDCSMGTIAQRPAGLLDSHHPSVEVITQRCPVATDTGFAEWEVSNTAVSSAEGQKKKNGRR